MNKRQAIQSVRNSADAIIEQLVRWDKGWDKGEYRDDVRNVDKCWMLPAKDSVIKEVEHAFAIAKEFN